MGVLLLLWVYDSLVPQLAAPDSLTFQTALVAFWYLLPTSDMTEIPTHISKQTRVSKRMGSGEAGTGSVEAGFFMDRYE